MEQATQDERATQRATQYAGRYATPDQGAAQDQHPKTKTPDDVPAISALSPLVERIDHVGLAVADLDAAIAFYARVFGLQSVHEEVNEEQGVREAMVDIAGSGSYLQLLSPLREDSPIGRFLARTGEGLQQLAFRVADIDVASQRLRDAGVRLLYPEPKRGTAGSRVNFVHPKDCGGVLVELVEPGAEHAAH